MSEAKDPVQEMRDQLAAVRRQARGVKDSARGLRIVRSPKVAEIVAPDVARHDATHPTPRSNTEDVTRPVR